MASRQRQMGHQDKEVEQVPHHHRDQLLEKSSKHALVGHHKGLNRCRKTAEVRSLPFAIRQSIKTDTDG